jgi:di/tripeptidase
MSNLTVVIDDDLLRAARIKALQQGTSVNEICREAIARFAAPVKDHAEWMRAWRALGQEIQAGYLVKDAPQPEPLWPSREAMYDEIMAERMPTLWARLTAEEAAREAKEQAENRKGATVPEPKPRPKR